MPEEFNVEEANGKVVRDWYTELDDSDPPIWDHLSRCVRTVYTFDAKDEDRCRLLMIEERPHLDDAEELRKYYTMNVPASRGDLYREIVMALFR